MPKDAATGYQDGNWTLTQLKLWNVFSEDGTEYTEEAPLIIDVSGENIKTKVVSHLNVSFAGTKNNEFGKTDGIVTGAFMGGYKISGLSVTITDFENKKVDGIDNVVLTLTHEQNTSSGYGGYSFATPLGDIQIPLTADSTGTKFTQGNDVTLSVAGNYLTSFSFDINKVSSSFSSHEVGAPTYKVYSVKPTVTITGRTNYDGSSTNGNTVTVAYGHSTETTCGITYHNYSQASVTLTLSGYGNASGAYLAFTESNGGDVHLYLNSQDAQNKKVDRYEWTADGACLRWVGYWNSQTGNDRATAAGTIKATQLVLTYGGAEYTVDIDDITIINPTPPS